VVVNPHGTVGAGRGGVVGATFQHLVLQAGVLHGHFALLGIFFQPGKRFGQVRCGVRRAGCLVRPLFKAFERFDQKLFRNAGFFESEAVLDAGDDRVQFGFDPALGSHAGSKVIAEAVADPCVDRFNGNGLTPFIGFGSVRRGGGRIRWGGRFYGGIFRGFFRGTAASCHHYSGTQCAPFCEIVKVHHLK